MKISLSIFPYKIRFLGFAFIVSAIPFTYLYFWGGKPDIFKINIFALVTTYMETRYFVLAQTNILDELAAILFISGIALVTFSKEKTEHKHFENLRIKAVVNSIYITIIFWALSFLFVYGMAIFVVSFSVFILFLVTYNLLFRIYLYKEKMTNDALTNN